MQVCGEVPLLTPTLAYRDMEKLIETINRSINNANERIDLVRKRIDNADIITHERIDLLWKRMEKMQEEIDALKSKK